MEQKQNDRTEAPSRLPQSDYGLVVRGLAEPSGAGVKAVHEAFHALQQLQAVRRKRLPAKSESGVAKNISWSGTIIFDLANIVSEIITHHENIDRQTLLRKSYRAFRVIGYDTTINQIAGALRIFADASNAEEVFDHMAAHSSYGDWCRDLDIEQRRKIHEMRIKGQRDSWERLPAEERKKKKELCRNKTRELIQSATQSLRPGLIHSGKIDPMKESLDLKDLEEGNLPGQAFAYEGVLEKMRSSWEALYARVINQRPDRFYYYEPLGFPILDPDTNKVYAYHPDFFVIKNRPNFIVETRIVEIKGHLTEIAQLKMHLFRKYYLDGDFSNLTDKQTVLMRRLVKKHKEIALKQFGIRINSQTLFSVYGEHRWSTKLNNFVENCENDKNLGFIPRLRRRFPKLSVQSADNENSLSRKRCKEISKKVSTGLTPLKFVDPVVSRRTKIQRSNEVFTDVNSNIFMYYNARLYSAAFTFATINICGHAPHPMEPLPVYPSPLALSTLAASFHANSDSEKERIFRSITEVAIRKESHVKILMALGYLECAEYALSVPSELRDYNIEDPVYYSNLDQILNNIRNMKDRLTQVSLQTPGPDDPDIDFVYQLREQVIRDFKNMFDNLPILFESSFFDFAPGWIARQIDRSADRHITILNVTDHPNADMAIKYFDNEISPDDLVPLILESTFQFSPDRMNGIPHMKNSRAGQKFKETTLPDVFRSIGYPD